MPIRHIPPKETRRWTGNYLGNYYGTLWKTHNIDLDRNEGQVGLASRMEIVIDSGDFTGTLSTFSNFIRTNADGTDRYWALRNRFGLLKTDSQQPENQTMPSDSWDSDALDSSPPSPIDFTIHGNDSRNDSGQNKLIVTTDSGDIAVLNDTGNNAWTGSWWVTKQSQPALSTNYLRHPIEFFPFRKITLVGDVNLIHTIHRPSDSQNDTVSYARLVLPNNLVALHIFTTTNRAWILTYDKFGGEGSVVEWDGFSQSYNNIHKIYSMAALTGVNYKDTPIILNSQGSILEFTGRGFVPMERNGQKVMFPMIEEPVGRLGGGTDTSFGADVFPRGSAVGEDDLVYFNMGSDSGAFRQASGIWCLNPRTGRLYNKYAFGQYGDSVDYGQQVTADAGGLLWITSGAGPLPIVRRNLLAGHTIRFTATTGRVAAHLLEDPTITTPQRGNFITQYIPADEVLEFWDTLWLKYKRFASSGNSIIVKARGTRPMIASGGTSLEKTITWTAATTFTVTLAAADDALQVGDEVDVVAGGNAGFLSHITDISGAHGALQTITVDETMTTTSGTATARFDRWKKIGTVTSADHFHQKINIGIDYSFIQFKVELRGVPRELEVQELIVSSRNSIKEVNEFKQN